MAPRSSCKGGVQDEEARVPLTAVLMCDSFTQNFRPVSLEHPKMLLPLVNIPMIEYALEWLTANHVEQVVLFFCSNADAIKGYIQASKWQHQRRITIVFCQDSTCRSAGDALRLIESRDIIKGDFIVMPGDVVCNAPLAPMLEAHKARRAKDKAAIMTLTMKSSPSEVNTARMHETGLCCVIDTASKRLVAYQLLEGPAKDMAIDCDLFSERDSVQVRCDLVDANIYICAPEVLMLFSDNFDFQNIRRDFITGVLSEEELGNKLFTYEIGHFYSARVHSFRSYDAISKDIVARWSFPFVPDTNLLTPAGGGTTSFRFHSGNRYTEGGLMLPSSCTIGSGCVIGAGTRLGANSRLKNAVLGRKVTVGKGVTLMDCYVHDGVTIHDGARVAHSLVCAGAVLGRDAVVSPGCILSQRVVVAPSHTVPPASFVTLCQTRESAAASADSSSESDDSSEGSEDNDAAYMRPSDEVLEAAAAASDLSAMGGGGPWQSPAEATVFDADLVGGTGAGFAWRPTRDDPVQEQLRSVAPLFPQALATLAERGAKEEAAAAAVRERSEGGGAEDEGEEGDEDDVDDAEVVFKQEVMATFLRCLKDHGNKDNTVLELNALKMAEVKTFADVAKYIFSTICALCLPMVQGVPVYHPFKSLFPPPGSIDVSTKPGKVAMLHAFHARISEWGPLLRRFLKEEDDQVELLLTFEDFCSEEGVFARDGGALMSEVFGHLLHLLYDGDIVEEDAFLSWAAEKQHADEDEKVYLVKAEPFLHWLSTVKEESDSEESD